MLRWRPLSVMAMIPRRSSKRLVESITPTLDKNMARSTQKVRPVDGFLEGVQNGNLTGWVYCPSSPSTRLSLEVVVDGNIRAAATADEFRGDLVQAGKGDGKYGFSIPVDRLGLSLGHESRLDVNVTGPMTHHLGHVMYTASEMDPDVLARFSAAVGALPLEAGVLYTEDGVDWNQPNEPLYELLFDPPAVPAVQEFPSSKIVSKQTLSGYLDFTRYRLRKDRTFRVDQSEDDFCAFLKWYLDHYSRVRGYRVPFSAQEISYLNTLVHVPGTNNSLSRITWAYLLQDNELYKTMSPLIDDHFLRICYWWTFEKAPSLRVEDCLIPRAYEDKLMRVRDEWRMSDYPLPMWMEIHFNRSVFLHFLDLRIALHRQLYYLYILLASIGGFKFIRYMPRRWVDEFFQGDARELSRLVSLLSSKRVTLPFRDQPEYSRLLLRDGFDLTSASYRYWTPKGHRVHSAALPRPAAREPILDVQLIGPLDKASGLGQAARLSSDILQLTGLSFSPYNFSLDNPAPLQAFRGSEHKNPRRAKINLIHLNAESIPLVYAYMPDVFSGAYNVGYFFWELDTPADAHFLALNLLDEVWVSTDFGRSIYEPFTPKPVCNVGMAYEDSITVDRQEARRFVETNYGIPDPCFRFFVAFDSFSFVQRKNPLGVLAAFQAAFPQDPTVRLIIKTHNKDFVFDPIQERIWREVISIAERDDRIILINRTLSYSDLLLLKAGCDCYVSLHRAEGWGFGLVEAMGAGIPVVATNYSGNMEFCRDDNCWLVESDLKYVHDDDYIFVKPGQKWAEPRIDRAVEALRQVRCDSDLRAARVENGQKFVRSHFSKIAIAERYRSRLSEIISSRSP